MLGINNILFPTDFSRCAGQALQHALFMAKFYGARLHMLHSIILHQEDPYNPAHSFPYPKELHEILKKMATERMNNDLKTSNEDEKEVDVIFEELRGFSATDLILKYADEHDIDLIVMGTHGRRGLNHIFLGSIAQEVVRRASCPVYTIRESERPNPPKKIDKILLPVDISDYSKIAISMAKEVAKINSAKLQLLNVVEDAVRSAFHASGKETILEFNPDIVDHSQKAMKRIFDESPEPDVAADFKVVTGRVANQILKYAHRNSIDLIIIATHGLSALKRFLLGSVAEKLILRSTCPVLAIKAIGKLLISCSPHLVQVDDDREQFHC